jgi:hypothetical protein
MKKFWAVIFIINLCFYVMSLPAEAGNQTIKVQQLNSAPQVDGITDDWQKIQTTAIPLNGKLAIKEVLVKAGVFGDSIYFLWQWQDSTKDTQHKPYMWDNKSGKYVAGPQMEDRFSVNFAMEGSFTFDWFSGQTFKADMWHWKAARSNPNGLAQDKMTIITKEPSKKAFKINAKNNSTIYLLRPSDKGDKLYSTKRYAVKEKDQMPKYILASDPKGSIADVKAKGVWSDNTWSLEESRKLNTGNADDVLFKVGSTVASAIAVFNRSGDENHNHSDTIIFELPK